VTRRCPDNPPFSIILALDEFKFQYKHNSKDGELETVSVPIGYVAFFSSTLSHCGGPNGTGDYIYHVFANVVSNLVDYLDGTIEIDHENDDRKMIEGGMGVVKGQWEYCKKGMLGKRKELKAPSRYDQE
jgi:hypothetical protein